MSFGLRRAFGARRGFGLLVLAATIGDPPAISAQASSIESLVQAVSGDSLFNRVVWLESYGTRRADTPQAAQAAAWMAGRMASWGADSVFMHQWGSAYAPNVVGVRRGTTRPNRIVLVGGHYDSITPFQDVAPGADDNASGTACVLECARILCTQRFEFTLQFAAFSAEELGLIGSNAYAAHLASRGDTLVAMLNVDMIGYLGHGDRRDLDIIFNNTSRWLRTAAVQATAQYVSSLPTVDGAYLRGNSDQQSFWNRGFSAISFFEDSDNPSPYIHTGNDLVLTSFNDVPLATGATQAAVALLATLARPLTTPIALEEFAVRRAGEDNRLTWRLAQPADWRGVAVERASDLHGPWSAITTRTLTPASEMEYVDPGMVASACYRLALHRADGEIIWSAGISAEGGVFAAALAAIDRGDVGVDVRWSIGGTHETRLAVFDARGRQVRVLMSGVKSAGTYVSTWDRRDDAGAHAARGVYFVQLRADGAAATRKVVVAR